LFYKLQNIATITIEEKIKNVFFFLFFVLFHFVLGVSYCRESKTCCEKELFLNIFFLDITKEKLFM
jgi:hypothetical protein